MSSGAPPDHIAETDYRYGRIRYPKADRFYPTTLGLTGDYYRLESICYDLVVESGWQVVEIGANIGVFTVQLAKLAPDGHVRAIEPQPGMAEILRMNLEINGLRNVTVLPCLVGAAPGTVIFRVPDPRKAWAEGRGANFGGFGLHIPESLAAQMEQIPVEMIRYSDLEGRVDFLKIDCEGHEDEVIGAGLEKILDERTVLHVEADRPGAYPWLETLIGKGYRAVEYRPYILNDRNLNFKGYATGHLSNRIAVNLLLFPAGMAKTRFETEYDHSVHPIARPADLLANSKDWAKRSKA